MKSFKPKSLFFVALLCAQPLIAQSLATSLPNQRIELDRLQAQLIAEPIPASFVALQSLSNQQGELDSKMQALIRLQDAKANGFRSDMQFIDASEALASLPQDQASAGSRCTNPLLFNHKQALTVYFEPQRTLWLRVAVPENTLQIVDSIGSHADTLIEVLSDCAEVESVKSADDSFGLQARLALPRRNVHQTYLVRVQSLSAQVLPVRLRFLQGATLSGRLQREDGSAVRAAATFFDEQQRYLGSDFSNESTGTYEIAVPEAIARVYLRTEKLTPSTWINAVYPSGVCRPERALSSCSLTNAQLILTPANSAITLAPLPLPEGAKLRGVVSVPAGAASQPVSVSGVTAQGVTLFSGATDAVGRYQIQGLFPEPVLVYANGVGLLPSIHPNLPCQGPSISDCPLAQAQPVFLQLGSTAIVNFDLQRAGGVNLLTPNFTWNDSASVSIFRPNGTFVFFKQLFGPQTFIPLLPGSYLFRVQTRNSFMRVLPNIDCIDPCFEALMSTPPIVIGSDIIEVPVVFRALPEVRIRLKDRITQLPVAGLGSAFGVNNNFQSYATEYQSGTGELRFIDLQPGTYKLFAGGLEHYDQAFPGVACSDARGRYYQSPRNCPGMQTLSIGLNSPDVIAANDFILERSSSIGGQNGTSLIYTFNVAGQPLFSEFAFQESGRYRLLDLYPGTYKLGISDGVSFDQLFQNQNCALGINAFEGCNFALATAITLAAGQQVENVDFTPRLRKAIRGTLLDDQNNAPIGNAIIDLWTRLPNDTLVISASVRSDPQGRFEFATSSPGFISTDFPNRYLNMVYPNIQCPAGSAASGLCNPGLGEFVPVSESLSGGEITLRVRANEAFQNGFEN